MKVPAGTLTLVWIVALSTMIFAACTPSPSTEQETTLTSAQDAFSQCKPAAGVSASPKTIEEAVALINSLPKPLSVPCFVASLSRPLKVSLTSSINSAQPAVGTRSPRIFISLDSLLISVVPEGSGQDLVELSYVTSTSTSVKAEILFPVTGVLSKSAPYDRIIFTGPSTTCGFCHLNENRYTKIDFATAYESRAFQPRFETLVPLGSLRGEAALCDPSKEPKRCALLNALFNKGDVQKYDFPAAMPTFF